LAASANKSSGAIAVFRPRSTLYKNPSKSFGNGPSGTNKRINADVSTTSIIADDPFEQFPQYRLNFVSEGSCDFPLPRFANLV
jgi:hypothetical protein